MAIVQPGSHLGPYEVLAQVGAGGMGEVWKARDTRLDRSVAIKTSSEQFSERFEREARAIAALNHPHICQLYDVGPNYLVMEYIEGQPLRAPLPLDQALKYGAQICDALDAAHRKGIVHRDLKPANILVTKTGVKLLDFGLARIGPAVTADDKTAGGLTGKGQILGTLHYMSPEQLQGEKADSRSDTFSFGLVLYEMLTGKRAFDGSSPASVIAAILEREAPSVAGVAPAILDRVLRRCLAKDPDRRWQSASDLKSELEWIAESSTSATTAGAPALRKWRERTAWILSAAFLAGLLFFAGLYWTTPAQTPGMVVRLSVNPPGKTIFANPTNATVPVVQFALSPDGRTIIFLAGAAGSRPMLWVRSLDDLSARPLPGTEDGENPFWSPDGLWVGFFAEGKLKKISASGGAVHIIAGTDGGNLGGSWGPNDTILFADGNRYLSRVSSGSGAVTPVTQPPPQEESHRWPHFLPDGQHFLYTVRSGLAERRGVYVGSLDGKTQKHLNIVDSSAFYGSPGYLLYVDGDTLLGHRFDANRLELDGQPFTVVGKVGHATTGQVAVSVSSTGTMAHAESALQLGRLTWFDRGGNPVHMNIPEGDYTDFRLSPNERQLAASRVNLKTGQPEIWMTDIESGISAPFVVEASLNSAVVWSPDGTRLIFRTNRDGQTAFYQKSAAGGGTEEIVLAGSTARDAGMRSNSLIPSDWSRGENLIFRVQLLASGDDLAFLPFAGVRKPMMFINSLSNQMHGNFSLDGRFVAYTSNESGRFEVHVETFPRSDFKRQISTSGGYEPRWRGDGSEIYYLSDDRKLMAVPVAAGPSFGRPQPLFQTQVPAGVSPNRTHYVPTRDGRRFLINTQSGDAAPIPITVVLNWTVGLKK